MNEFEYTVEKEILKNEYETNLRKLKINYAMSNNPYKIDDIITDHICSIKIESIQCWIGFEKFPECVYFGTELKKNLEPRKDGRKAKIYQSNIEVKK